jgi:hypothetical protein
MLKEVANVGQNMAFVQEGLLKLVETTHLVERQIQENLPDYIQEFDEGKFSHKIGMIKKVLESGVFGVVFSLSNGKIFKLTLDFKEAPFLYKYCYKTKTVGFVEVDKVYEDDFGKTKCFYVVRDPVKRIADAASVNEVMRHYKAGQRNVRYNHPVKDGVSRALQAMYNLDNNWRGTHIDNLATQNDKVVLYDGFSKNVALQAGMEKF